MTAVNPDDGDLFDASMLSVEVDHAVGFAMSLGFDAEARWAR
jgi:hypothetical protein